VTDVLNESSTLDLVPVDTPESSDEFVPEVADVYELVDAAEDRIAALVAERFDLLEKKLFAVIPDGDGNPQPIGALSIVMAQSQYLGEHLLPAVSELHGKFDAVIADVRAFIEMVKNSRLPGIGRLMGKKGGKDDATEEEDGN